MIEESKPKVEIKIKVEKPKIEIRHGKDMTLAKAEKKVIKTLDTGVVIKGLTP